MVGEGSEFLLLPEGLVLLLLGGGEELIHLKRTRDVAADRRLRPATGGVVGSGRGAGGAHRLRAVDQAARRRLPRAPASKAQQKHFKLGW